MPQKISRKVTYGNPNPSYECYWRDDYSPLPSSKIYLRLWALTHSHVVWNLIQPSKLYQTLKGVNHRSKLTYFLAQTN